jgi:hypothetical protein
MSTAPAVLASAHCRGRAITWQEISMMNDYGMGLGMGFGWLGTIVILAIVGLTIATLIKYPRK